MMSPAYRSLTNLSHKIISGDWLMHERVAIVLVCAYPSNIAWFAGSKTREDVILYMFDMDDSEWSITRDAMIEYVGKSLNEHSNISKWARDVNIWIKDLDSCRAFT